MIIARGGTWGEPAPGVEALRFDSVAELARAALTAWETESPFTASTDQPDVLTQLGLAAVRPPDQRFRYPFDLGVACLDGGPELPFLAHLQARRARWSGTFAVVMNVGWVGNRYFGPRAHPNDGLVDITVGSLGWRERLGARRRLATGSHLPHPMLASHRTSAWSHRFERPVPVLLDGRKVGRSRTITVRCLPDCLTLVV